MVLGVTVDKVVVLLLQHFFQEVGRQKFVAAAHKRGDVEVDLFL